MTRSAEPTTVPRLATGGFPDLGLPLPLPYPPMEATTAEKIPSGSAWQFEPKWDGFRCLVFRRGERVVLQSKAGQPLDRYFPELIESLQALPHRSFVLDGEIVIPTRDGLSFDDLLQRIHPAVSRITRLAGETPGRFVSFDLLYDQHAGPLTDRVLEERRINLERFFKSVPDASLVRLSPATRNHTVAEDWFDHYGPFGLDGIMAKRLGERYRSGERSGMIKVKRFKTADCVVGGFRGMSGGRIGSLLLGLFDDQRQLTYVGHTSSFTDQERLTLRQVLEPLKAPSSFQVRMPGGPSRWSKKEQTEWQAVRPELVCEVRYDYFSQNRFRHGTKFLRWRPDKDPSTCTWDQVVPEKDRAALPTLLTEVIGR